MTTQQEVVWFCAHTAEIRSEPSAYSNFYEYVIPAKRLEWLQYWIEKRTYPPGSLYPEYPEGFLEEIGELDAKTRRRW